MAGVSGVALSGALCCAGAGAGTGAGVGAGGAVSGAVAVAVAVVVVAAAVWVGARGYWGGSNARQWMAA